jgi:glycosyltransferase involved in cell wall biosynthesis/GT2 family glycosyltransferase
MPEIQGASCTRTDQAASVTVVICAYSNNRWDTLRTALDVTRKQMSFSDELLIIIDHNEHLLEKCRESFTGCLAIANRHSRGLSGARNTALEVAHGSIIVFLDDDAVPLDGWLDALRAPYTDEHVAGVGGMARPHWFAGHPPAWFPEEFLWVVGCSHRGLPSQPSPVRNLLGANMSFRRTVFDQVGGFAEHMGRIGERPLGCEETEFSIRLTQASPKAILLYEPKAKVEHHVAEQRASLTYFSKRCWAEGLSKAEVSRRVGRSSALSTERQYTSRVLPRAVWQGLRDCASGDIWGATRSLAVVWGLFITTAGYCAGSLRQPAALSSQGAAAQRRRALPSAAHPASPVSKSSLAVGPASSLSGVTESRPLRVLVVTARFFPDLGGTETHVHEVTRRMAKRGDLDLTILTTDRSGRLAVREEIDGFRVLRCRSYPRYRDYYFAPGLYGLIRAGRYDVIHCQGIHTAVPIIAMISAIRAGIPYVVTFHTGGHSSGLRRQIRNTQWHVLEPLLRRATTLVAVSRFEQRIFQKACRLEASRFRLVQNGGGLLASAGRATRIEGRIVSSGRLEQYKGHQRLIEALPIVQQSIPGATLRILGSGPYEARLRALVEALGLKSSVTIEYIAPTERRRMAESLAQAAVFAVMSEYEAHPVAVMEALALGIPTVGLDTAGIADLVEDGLVEGVPHDASATTIARTLIAALNRRDPRPPVVLPTWENAANDLAQIYQHAAGAGLRSPGSCDP